MKIFKQLLAYTLILSVSACASIAGSNTRAVKVDSYPAGATITVDNQQYGQTPAVITLPNYIYGGKSVTVSKPGYQAQTMMVNAKFQPVALFDILLWPTFLIDAATGDLVKVDPANLNLFAKLQRA